MEVEWTGLIEGLFIEKERNRMWLLDLFFFFDYENIDAVTEKKKNGKRRQSYFGYINFEMILSSHIKMSGRELSISLKLEGEFGTRRLTVEL